MRDWHSNVLLRRGRSANGLPEQPGSLPRGSARSPAAVLQLAVPKPVTPPFSAALVSRCLPAGARPPGLVRAVAPAAVDDGHVQPQALHHVDPQVREQPVPESFGWGRRPAQNLCSRLAWLPRFIPSPAGSGGPTPLSPLSLPLVLLSWPFVPTHPKARCRQLLLKCSTGSKTGLGCWAGMPCALRCAALA